MSSWIMSNLIAIGGVSVIIIEEPLEKWFICVSISMEFYHKQIYFFDALG